MAKVAVAAAMEKARVAKVAVAAARVARAAARVARAKAKARAKEKARGRQGRRLPLAKVYSEYTVQKCMHAACISVYS